MKVLKMAVAAIIETALIIGALFLFDEESIAFCAVLIFLLLFIPLMGYYIIKEKKPIWILIVLILLLPLTYFANMGIVHIQDKNYEKQMNTLADNSKVKAQEMTDSLKTLLESGDVKGLKEIFDEETIDELSNKIDVKNIKLENFGEDLEVEPYDSESWGAYGTGSFKQDGTKYYIEYSITGTKKDANYLDVTIIPYDLYEKASAITDESSAEEADKIYAEVEDAQVYIESKYSIENQGIDSLMDLEE